MKDKLNKVGRKRSLVFNHHNFILAFFALSLSALIVIPTYITINHLEAKALEKEIIVEETKTNDNSTNGDIDIITYN